MARVNLGQHFLTDSDVIQKIIGALTLARGDTVLELGAGHGALTFPLAALSEKKDFSLFAVEKDTHLAEELEKKLGGNKTAHIIRGDLREALPEFARNKKGEQFTLVGNIPYYLTGYLFRLISELEVKPKITVLTIQKEVAERVTALPPAANKLSASVRFWGDPEIVGLVPQGAFSPPPEVHSAILRIKPVAKDPKIAPGAYYRLVRILFAQPRKTLLNNVLGNIRRKNSESVPREEILKKLASCDIKPGARPQDLSVNNIIRIAEVFKEGFHFKGDL
ncbi:MAG: Ribosomal RNA small subunit methyltransferase A [Parcubacteria group bacterium GW2011_GWA1_50_14]|nr:MAG: Ribosomal RNA small subunit methyltransferase A [Parcubacteria group bacterium GW2011_GWA1_50_14]